MLQMAKKAKFWKTKHVSDSVFLRVPMMYLVLVYDIYKSQYIAI